MVTESKILRTQKRLDFPPYPHCFRIHIAMERLTTFLLLFSTIKHSASVPPPEASHAPQTFSSYRKDPSEATITTPPVSEEHQRHRRQLDALEALESLDPSLYNPKACNLGLCENITQATGSYTCTFSTNHSPDRWIFSSAQLTRAPVSVAQAALPVRPLPCVSRTQATHEQWIL
jgi:hypothetical protein